MRRPDRDRNRSSVDTFNKFARYFGMFMTLVYVALGLFILFMDETQYNLNLPDTSRKIFGGVLILYGIVRFVRAYQVASRANRERDND